MCTEVHRFGWSPRKFSVWTRKIQALRAKNSFAHHLKDLCTKIVRKWVPLFSMLRSNSLLDVYHAIFRLTDGSFLIGAHFCARAGCIGVYKSAPQSKKTGRYIGFLQPSNKKSLCDRWNSADTSVTMWQRFFCYAWAAWLCFLCTHRTTKTCVFFLQSSPFQYALLRCPVSSSSSTINTCCATGFCSSEVVWCRDMGDFFCIFFSPNISVKYWN